MPESGVARTIILVKLPPDSRAHIMRGDGDEEIDIEQVRIDLEKAFSPGLFDPAEQEKITVVQEFVARLTGNQPLMLIEGLRNCVEEEAHSATVHFLEFTSGYEIEGVGLEIRDDTVVEEGLHGPIRVMFVTWNS